MQTVKRRLVLFRLMVLLIPLAFCLIFSAGTGFLLVNFYENHFEGEIGEGASSETVSGLVEIFKPHVLSLIFGGIVFLCFLTGMIFLIQTLLNWLLVRGTSRPLDDLAEKISSRGSSLGESALESIRAVLTESEEAIGQQKCLAPQLEKIALLKHQVDQFLILSALDRGEFPANTGSLELGRFLGDLVRELAEGYRNRGLVLKLVENREPLKISTDVLWLRTVLVHLLDNSAKHKRLERGTSVIRYRQRTSSVIPGEEILPGTPGLAEITFTDNGPGLSAEDLPALFELRPGETGNLTLALCARIIKHLGGSIYAERPGKGGLSVVICFPEEEGSV